MVNLSSGVLASESFGKECVISFVREVGCHHSYVRLMHQDLQSVSARVISGELSFHARQQYFVRWVILLLCQLVC